MPCLVSKINAVVVGFSIDLRSTSGTFYFSFFFFVAFFSVIFELGKRVEEHYIYALLKIDIEKNLTRKDATFLSNIVSLFRLRISREN